MVFHIPYEIIEKIAGTWVADHFNEISIFLLLAGALYVLLFRNGGGPKAHI